MFLSPGEIEQARARLEAREQQQEDERACRQELAIQKQLPKEFCKEEVVNRRQEACRQRQLSEEFRCLQRLANPHLFTEPRRPRRRTTIVPIASQLPEEGIA